jgi:fructose-1,6-bisphosphatase I
MKLFFNLFYATAAAWSLNNYLLPPGDWNCQMTPYRPLLAEFLDQSAPADVAAVILAIAGVAAQLSTQIARVRIESHGQAATSVNSDGDTQKPLDLYADNAFTDALAHAPVRWLVSEERPDATLLDPSGTLAVAIDPLDGSSNIDVNVSVGTIFSVLPALADADATFLRSGRNQLAAGYVVFGPHTSLVITLGAGVAMFVLDPDSRQFCLLERDIKVPPAAADFAINASNYRFWPLPIRTYVNDCISGEEGPRGKNFNMRWIASLVAETHRILLRGGVFLYPEDSRKGYERGRLRHLYECAPIAFLMEQAGGGATDGRDQLLDRVPDSLHDRTPFVFGSATKVARVAAYFDLPETSTAPLFRTRGLFDVGGIGR